MRQQRNAIRIATTTTTTVRSTSPISGRGCTATRSVDRAGNVSQIQSTPRQVCAGGESRFGFRGWRRAGRHSDRYIWVYRSSRLIGRRRENERRGAGCGNNEIHYGHHGAVLPAWDACGCCAPHSSNGTSPWGLVLAKSGACLRICKVPADQVCLAFDRSPIVVHNQV